MSEADCKTCDHRHIIDGKYVTDCYSVCPVYQENEARRRELKEARKKRKLVDDCIVKTKIKISKRRE